MRVPDIARADDLLPIGLSDGARLVRDLPIAAPVRFSDLTLPADRISERLWREQLARFDGQRVAPLGSGVPSARAAQASG